MIVDITNLEEDRLAIAENMKKYGGSFVKALAECVIRADLNNLVKLYFAFPNYFEEYKPENWGEL